MQLNERLHRAYDEVTQHSREQWDLHADGGKLITTPFYHPTRRALSSGNKPPLSENLLSFIAALNQAVQGDPLADVTPEQGVHFSFFPITRDLYERAEDAAERHDVQAIFTRHCADHVMHIRQLRLVALPNQILLAGIPDERSLQVRQTFAEALLASPWEAKIRARYPAGEIPQLFWHSTLMRYSAEFVSPAIREVFARFQHCDFGNVSLPVRLVLCNYNWQQVTYLA